MQCKQVTLILGGSDMCSSFEMMSTVESSTVRNNELYIFITPLSQPIVVAVMQWSLSLQRIIWM